jgi:hypothetical protein
MKVVFFILIAFIVLKLVPSQTTAPGLEKVGVLSTLETSVVL